MVTEQLKNETRAWLVTDLQINFLMDILDIILKMMKFWVVFE